MATDSMKLTPRPAVQKRRRRRSDTPKIDSPARPILRGVGLDAPFFEDKNRAFWFLQSLGWTGYFFLRSLSGFANSMGPMWIVHTALLTATGYSLTLLMGALFRRLIRMRVVWTGILSLAAVVIASMAFSIIETWSYATFLKPDSRPAGFEYLGAILLNFALLAAWAALYYGINYYILLEDQITQRERLESQASSAQPSQLPLSATSILTASPSRLAVIQISAPSSLGVTAYLIAFSSKKNEHGGFSVIIEIPYQSGEED
jgi:hypothetical protein